MSNIHLLFFTDTPYFMVCPPPGNMAELTYADFREIACRLFGEGAEHQVRAEEGERSVWCSDVDVCSFWRRDPIPMPFPARSQQSTSSPWRLRHLEGRVMLERRHRKAVNKAGNGVTSTTVTLELHVVYSPAYATPVLYYNAYRSGKKKRINKFGGISIY